MGIASKLGAGFTVVIVAFGGAACSSDPANEESRGAEQDWKFNGGRCAVESANDCQSSPMPSNYGAVGWLSLSPRSCGNIAVSPTQRWRAFDGAAWVADLKAQFDQWKHVPIGPPAEYTFQIWMQQNVAPQITASMIDGTTPFCFYEWQDDSNASAGTPASANAPSGRGLCPWSRSRHLDVVCGPQLPGGSTVVPEARGNGCPKCRPIP